MAQRSQAIASTLEAARTREVNGVSDDGSVSAVAAGGRLVEVVPAASAGHEAVVSGMLQAARAALAESNRVVAEATRQTSGPT